MNLFGGEQVARHGMIKQLVALNVGLYGAYMLMSGPMALVYKNYLTLDTNSSILSVPLCHLGHTSAITLLFNSGVLWTIGNSHAKAYGCMRFVTVFGAGCAVASILGALEVYKNGGSAIAGGLAGSSALIAYNTFANPTWFNIMSKWTHFPLMNLALLALYGAYYNDKAIIGGVAGGYAAMLLAL